MTTIASSTGLSRFATAWAVRLPRPLRPNTVSVTTAPATSSPNSRPAIVRAGSVALRMTALTSNQPSDAPFARDTWTKDCVRTSATARMSTCASGADRGIARVSVGRMRASTGPGSTTFTHPSWKLSTWMITMPSQNTGTETKSAGAESTTFASHDGFP